jgi:hypothetical protein
MSRIFAAFLLIVVLAVGGSAIAATAYQAGVTTGAAQVATGGSTVVTPIIVPVWGIHPFAFGFGFLGFLGTFFFLILVFGLFRAIFWGGRHRHGWGPGGYGTGGPGGPGGPGGSNGQRGWGGRERFRGTFDEWHSEAHAASGTSGPPTGTTSAPAPTDATATDPGPTQTPPTAPA